MKRALPSYEDLNDNLADILEDGEIIENRSDVVEIYSSDDEDFGQKPVLPVAKFDSTFKEGDEATSGEQYLCIVQTQRKRIGKVLRAVDVEVEANSDKCVNVDDLLYRYGLKTVTEASSVEPEWAERYWQCYEESEKAFLNQIKELENEDDDNSDLSNDFLNCSAQELMKKLYEDVEMKPTITFLREVKQDQDFCERLLNLHTRWIRDETCFDADENLSNLFTWIQALLMCRDRQLSSIEVANLRQLAAQLVSKFGSVRPEIREIVLVISKKYGQIDLIK